MNLIDFVDFVKIYLFTYYKTSFTILPVTGVDKYIFVEQSVDQVSSTVRPLNIYNSI